VAVVEGVGLMLRPRSGTGGRAVLVADAPFTAWWAALVVADPGGAPARLLSALAAADADARPTERYRVLDGDALVPSVRPHGPVLRDTSPPSAGGRWIAYVPHDGE
jgi:hypothetical protein